MTIPAYIDNDRDLVRVRELARHSLTVIEANQAPTGAYVASPNFPVYGYSWFRDGSFIADAMSRAGRASSADNFFGWCAGVVTQRADRIESLLERNARGEGIAGHDFLACRYTVDGDDVAEEWWEFQLDGYGTWLWALDLHAARHLLPLDGYAHAAELTVRYLTAFWAEPCYDWWEEYPQHRHTSTLAALYGGLVAAADWEILAPDVRDAARAAAGEIRARILDEGVRHGRLVKWLDGTGIDASLIACATPFGVVGVDEPLMTETVAALESTVAHGGVHRYPEDTYFGGGEWPLLAGLLGWHYANTGRTADAWAELLWIADQAQLNGDLPEQVSGHLLSPDNFGEWKERWGPVATPLLWSHAMFVTLAHTLGVLENAAEPA